LQRFNHFSLVRAVLIQVFSRSRWRAKDIRSCLLKKLGRAFKKRRQGQSREEELQQAAQWISTPRVRLLQKWSFCASTDCAEARGQRFVCIYIYICKYWLQGTRKGEFKFYNTCRRQQRKRKNTLANIHACTSTYWQTHIILQTLLLQTHRGYYLTNVYKQTHPYLQSYNHTKTQTYNPTTRHHYTCKPTPPYTYNTYILIIIICNENKK